MAIEAGQVVLFVSPTASWSYGTAREVVGSGVRVESYLDDGQDSNGVENVVPLEAVYPIADSSVLEEEPDDLLDLTDGHEGVLLQSLRKRFSHDVVYTAIANDIVVYINPSNEKIPWYQPSEMARYVGMTDLRRLMPHTWSLGCSAYRSILTDGRNQTLLFTGDIGSGKTCAMRSVARLILEEAADKTAVAPPPRPGSAPARPLRAVFETVRQGAVLLEAFGCAKVKGSASSTRYCHMTRYYFEPTGRLVGVHCDAFNLDRSRAAQPAAAGERTFHSFYQLLASKDGAKLFSLHLGADERRDHLGGGDWEADAAALAGAWKETNNAMRAVGIKEAEGWSCWAVVAGILHLSSVRFVDEPSAETGEFAVVVAPDTSKYLRLAAYAFGVPLPRLQQALLYMDDLARNRTVEECASAKAVLCTTLYARMFQWLVARVNAATDVDFDMTSIDGLRSIALLDSTGFESPASGSFEHLCNNTVNEVLQNHYNACVLAADVAECRAENLFAEPAAFYDNSGAVDLLCNENGGLLALIDSHSKANASDDEGLARKMARAHECNSSFRADVLRPLLVNVGHYAGEVAYNLAGWGTTGTAEAADALAAAFGQSKDKVVAGLFASPDENDGLTVAAALRHKLAAVMEAVGSSVPRWVRCIKPNADGRPAAFDGNLVMAQLKSSAVPETTRLRRSGFPARLSKRDFVARFRCLLRAPEGKGSLASQCCAILDRLRLTNFDAQIGSSKVFLKVAVLAALEAGRIEALKEHAVVLQRYALFALAKSEKAAAVLRSNEGLLKGIAAKLQLRAALVKTHDRSRGAVVEKEDEARLVLRRDVVAGWHALEDSLWQEKVRDAEAKAHRERKRKEEQKKRNLRMILEREHAETARQKHLDRLKAAELVLKQEKAAAGGQRPASASKDLPVELARSALMGAAAPLLGADRGDRSNAGVGFEALVQQKTQSELARRVHDLEQAQKKQEAAEKQRQRELKARMKHTARCHEEEQERLRSFSDNERKRRVGAASCRVLKQSGVTDERLQKARQRREGLYACLIHRFSCCVPLRAGALQRKKSRSAVKPQPRLHRIECFGHVLFSSTVTNSASR
ncbi:Myosin-12, partial [Diplonema papillatum]